MNIPPCSIDDYILLATLYDFIAMLIENTSQSRHCDLIDDVIQYLLDPKLPCIKIIKTVKIAIGNDPSIKCEHDIDIRR